jgi:putative transposase
VIDRPDQVWSSDITYIRLRRGFVYLVAVMDWFSRYVHSWSVSITMDVHFCLDALERALSRARPEIFNTDQGSQFTSRDFTGMLGKERVRISMDGRGRAFDNIFIERLWRSVKYEEVYTKDYPDVSACIEGLGSYFRLYNERRPHQSLGYRTPSQVYREGVASGAPPPPPPGFNALKDSRGAGKKRQSPKKPCPSIILPPRRSGRSPALPYPPGGQGRILSKVPSLCKRGKARAARAISP